MKRTWLLGCLVFCVVICNLCGYADSMYVNAMDRYPVEVVMRYFKRITSGATSLPAKIFSN